MTDDDRPTLADLAATPVPPLVGPPPGAMQRPASGRMPWTGVSLSDASRASARFDKATGRNVYDYRARDPPWVTARQGGAGTRPDSRAAGEASRSLIV